MTFSEAAMIMMSGGGGGGTVVVYDPTELFTKGTPEFVIGPFVVGDHEYSIKIFKTPVVSYDEYGSWFVNSSGVYWPSLSANVIAEGMICATYIEDTLLWGSTQPWRNNQYKTSYRPTNYDVVFSSLYKDNYNENAYTQISYDSDRELTGYGYGVAAPVKYYHKDISTYYSAETGEVTSSQNASKWEETTIYLQHFSYDSASPFSGDELAKWQKTVNRDEWILYNQLNPDRYIPYP